MVALETEPLPKTAKGLPRETIRLAFLADSLHKACDLDGALLNYETTLALAPDFAVALHNYAIVLANLERLDEAEAALHRLLSVKPSDPIALFNLGLINSLRGRNEEALLDYDKSLEVRENVGALNNRGILLDQLGRFAEAAGDFDRAVALDDSDSIARFNRSGALLRLGLLKEAFRDIQVLKELPEQGDADWKQAVEDRERQILDAFLRKAIPADSSWTPGKPILPKSRIKLDDGFLASDWVLANRR